MVRVGPQKDIAESRDIHREEAYRGFFLRFHLLHVSSLPGCYHFSFCFLIGSIFLFRLLFLFNAE